MVVLRATQKVLRRLSGAVETPHASDTALGDWYANRLVVDKKPLLLLVSAESLIAALIPARDVRNLPRRLPTVVAERLSRLGIPDELISREMSAMAPVEVGRTKDRSVLGSMVDFAKMIPYYLAENEWDEASLPAVEALLAEMPCRVTGSYEDTIWPDKTTRRLLEEKWYT